jgi:predicted transcriptional regulator
MSSTRDDLHSFHQFVEERLAANDAVASLDELFTQWHDRQCRSDVNDAIRRGLADVEAGRFVPADQAMEKIRQQFGFAKE